MATIVNLKLKNFKSFRKADIPFAPGFTAIAGPNASGKCVAGDTRVLLASGESRTIKEIVDEKLASAKMKQFMEDGVVGFNDDPGFGVISLNPKTLKAEQRKVSAVVKRLAPKRMLEVRTRSGKKVTTTDYHPFFSISEKGVYSLEAKDLKQGQFIALPRITPIAERNIFLSELLDLIREEDCVYVPFSEKYLEITEQYLKVTGATLGEASHELCVPKNAIKGLKDRQAINFAHLVAVLRGTGHTDETIAELIPKVKGKTTSMESKMVWRNTAELSRLLGYMFAKGSVAGKNIRIVSESQEMIDDIKGLCEKLFGIKANVYKHKSKASDIILYSHAVYAIFSKFGLAEGVNARTKKIAPIFFRHSNEEHLRSFLDGYLSGDGYVSKSTISAVSASEWLAKDIESICLRIGMSPSVRTLAKSIRNRGFTGKYFEVTISGGANIQAALEKLALTNAKKMSRLQEMAGKRSHTNTDIIPNINPLIREACIEEGIRYARKKKGNVKLKSYTENACFPSRMGLQEVVEEELCGRMSQQAVLLRSIAHSDIFWDEISSTEEVKEPPKHVYDLCVEYSHNFVANNIFVHNSNVLDALLFAMGITSLRLLRASKLTELVNHDATEGYAKVELAIKDNSGKDIMITRMVDRTGKSVYKLDGKRKTLNEIGSLLLELGINPNGHNIVVQGDVTRVIEMNAKQRRQVIEEVAGLQEFEEKKEEAVKKLEKVEQKVKDAHLILNEREAYLQQLEQDRANALKYNELREETRRSKATILSEELRITGRVLEEGRQKCSGMREEIVEKRTERNRLQDEERGLEGHVEEATRKLIEASERTYSSLGREVEQKRGHINVIAERMNSKNRELEARRQRIIALREELKLTKKAMQEKELWLKAAREDAQKATEQSDIVCRQVDSRSPKFDSKAAKIKGDESRLAELLREIATLKDREHSLALARYGIEREAKTAARALQELEGAMKALGARKKTKEDAEKRILELEKGGVVEKLAAKEKELETIDSGIHELHGKAQSVEEEIDTLGRSKASCPVCEKPLEAGLKEAIRFKKAGEMNSAKAKIRTMQERRELLLKEKEKLRCAEKELLDLKGSLRAYAGVEEEYRKISQRVSSYRETVSQEKSGVNLAEEKEIARGIASLEKEKAIVEEKIKGRREGETGLEMATLIQKLHEYSAVRNEKESLAAKLETEIEKVLSARIGSIASETSAADAEIAELEKSLGGMESEKAEAEKALSEMEAELEKANKANRLLDGEKARLTAKISGISEKREALSQKIEAREKEVNELNIEISKNEVRVADLEEEFREYSGVEIFGKFALNELKKRLPEIEKEIEKLGAINMKSLENFEVFRKEVEEVRLRTNKLDEERLAVVEMIQKIDVRKLDVFMQCFSHVAAKFSELYYKFFGGEGQLDLSDKLNPLEGGLLIQAKYKEDTLKSIDAMSGGEKSLTALAFLFAIQSFEPAPFYIFDEVDAALDKENSVKVGNMIKGQSASSQFIAISHNDAVINQADQIIGVALNRQKSSVIGLRLRKGAHDEAPMPGQIGGSAGGPDESPENWEPEGEGLESAHTE